MTKIGHFEPPNIKTQTNSMYKHQSIFAKKYLPELVFIDAGLVSSLSETNLNNFLDLNLINKQL